MPSRDLNTRHQIPGQGHRHFSFEVTSLSTECLSSKTTSVILSRVWKEQLADTKLRKNTLKKLINHCCTKIEFSLNDIISKQKGGASMSSSLESVFGKRCNDRNRKENCKTIHLIRIAKVWKKTCKWYLSIIKRRTYRLHFS